MSSSRSLFRVVGAALALSLFWTMTARMARACAACGCGDPTLVAAGTEQPFAGRLRTSLELRYRSDSIGEPGRDEFAIEEFRQELAVAWAPSASLFLMANASLIERSVTDPSLAEYHTVAPGDAELRVKAFLYRDRPIASRWLLAGVLGAKLPTAPFRRDDQGALLPFEAQVGTGSWDALLGTSLAYFDDPFSGYFSVQLSVPAVTRAEFEPGTSLRTTLAVQYQAISWLAFRPALDGRVDAVAKEEGRRDPNTGGAVLYAGGDLLVSPLMDFTLMLGARQPVIQALNGFHDEGLILSAVAVLDW